MKKILFSFCITFVAIISTYFLFWWLSLGYYQKSEHWLKTVYEIKEYHSKNIKGKKIIIVSGSNGLFGINSSLLAERTGYEVINLAGHAGLTFNFLVEKVIDNARAGDIVLMPLEYGFYVDNSSLSKWQMDNMQSWGHDHIKGFSFWETIRYFRHSDFYGIITRLTTHESIPVDPISEALAYNIKTKDKPFMKWQGYSYKSMSYYGDILVDEKVTNDVSKTTQGYLLSGNVSSEFIRQAKSLDEKLKRVGAKLYFTWPASLKNSSLDFNIELHLQRALSLKSKINQAGLIFICDPKSFNLPAEHFFNTYYHLNYKGSLLRTLELSNCLIQEKLIVVSNKFHDDEELTTQVDFLYKKSIKLSVVSKHMEQRIVDLTSINVALENYYKDHGVYPKSHKWDGVYSNWGKSTNDWIPGLTPYYIKDLPRDPRFNSNAGDQYLYKSDGSNFKLIAHGTTEDCHGIKVYYPNMHDPKRGCWAFGFWSRAAENW